MHIAWRDGLDEVLLVVLEHDNFEDFCKFTQGHCTKREDKNSAPYFIRGGNLKENYRKDSNLISANLIALDIDSKTYKNPSPQIVHAYLLSAGLTHFIYTTTSHSEETPSYRVVLPYQTSTKEECKRATAYLVELLAPTEIEIDPVSFVWSQRWYVSSAEDTGTWYNAGDQLEVPEDFVYKTMKTNKSIAGVTEGMSIADINEQSEQGHEHGPSRSLAMKFANYGMPFEEALALMVKAYPEHHDGHHKQSLETAYIKVESEKLIMESGKTGAAPPKRETEDYLVPVFPTNAMKDWPEPWPLIWQEFKKIPRVLDECLLLPTVLSVNAFLLGGKSLTGRGRRPNMAFLSIASSTAHKDVNSKNVIYDLYTALVTSKKGPNTTFSKMVNGNSSITSDTAFLESFDEQGDLFWVNTEATHIFHQMAQAGNNAAVKAIESKIIEVVDGMDIQGKKKAGKDNLVKGIEDPNCQILLYTQPETIAAYVKPTTVDSGLLGRMLISIPKKRENVFNDVFLEPSETESAVLDKEFLDFTTELSSVNSGSVIHQIPPEENQKLRDWAMNDLQKMARKDESAIKMLTRLGISTEQLYAIVMGVVNKWEMFKGEELSESFNIDCLLPILNYWAQCKMYSLGEFVNTSADPLADAVIEAINDFITGKRSVQKNYKKMVEDRKVVPIGEIIRLLKGHKKLRASMDSMNDVKDFTMKIDRILKILVSQGTIIEVNASERKNSAKCYGFSEQS